MASNNPLRQYFRRPAVYLKLPSGGKYYDSGVLDMPESEELPVYPMTAIDDITARTPDALFNGSAMAEIIKSCVPNIKEPWKINNIDLDAIFIAIRSASGESTIEIETTCPNCQEQSNYGIDLLNILTQLKSADYNKPLTIDDLLIKFRPLTYKQLNQASLGQFEVQRSFLSINELTDENEKSKQMREVLTRITELTMEILAEAIESVQTPTINVNEKEFILDFLKNCDKDVYIQVRDYNSSLRETTQIKPINLKCTHCQHEYDHTLTLNMSDFFG